MAKGLMILPIGAGVIGQDDVPLVRIMDSDETPTSITVYGVVDTVQPVTSVTWTVNGVEQTGETTKSPVLELTNLQPETNYAITLRATNINGESSASARTITTKKVTTITQSDVLEGVTYYNMDTFYTGNIPTKDETDIVVNGRDVTVPTGYYAESETVSVSSEYIIPSGTKNVTNNGTEDVTQYAEVNVNVPASAVVSGTKNITNNGTEDVTNYANVNVQVPASAVDTGTKQITSNGTGQDVVGYANVDVNVQPTLYTPSNVTPTTSQQTIGIPQGYDGLSSVTVNGVTSAIDPNITSGNIKKDITILGVQGTFDPTPDLGTLQVTPTTSAQTLTPSGVDGWNEVDVSAVTSSIDANITAGNIKKDVSILGVTGTFEGGITPAGTLNIVNNGTYDITNYANVSVQVASGDYNFLCFTANEANCTVGIYYSGTIANKPTLYYSTDKTNWTEWDFSTLTLANQNDKVYFYGNNLDGFSRGTQNYAQFTTTGNLTLSGNIMTLITMYGDREYLPSDYCFYQLFKNTTITDASNLSLPVTTLTAYCYYMMFETCANLLSAPSTLPATTIPSYAYYNMFGSCWRMTSAPSIQATTIGEYACYSMFKGCIALTTMPSLPATTVGSSGYRQMFQNCSGITTASELPAPTIGTFCYESMFKGCTSLTTSPSILPSTTLQTSCYQSMFNGCTSLTTAPILPATTLASKCYQSMFDGCTLINSINVYATTWNTSYTASWLNNVAASGIFVKPIELQTGSGSGQIPLDNKNGIPSGWVVYEIPSIADNNDYLTINAATGNDVYYTTDGSTPTTSSTLYTTPIDCSVLGDTFTLKYIFTDNNSFTSSVFEYKYFNMFYVEALENNTVLNTNNLEPPYPSNPTKVQYSTDKTNWNDIAKYTSTITLANTGDKVYFRKKTVSGNTWGQGNITTNSGTIKAGGSLEYAVYYEITGNRPASGGCGNLFQSCTGLVDASKLVLFGSYYANMFDGCTSLTTAPELPATELTIQAYDAMFKNCTSLVNIPSALPATTIDNYSYREMFRGCTGITTAPSIVATTLGESCCYRMFYNCTALTTAPLILPATVRKYQCYYQMFYGCSALTTAPKIMIADIKTHESGNGRVLYGMFDGCTSLQNVEIATTNWDTTSAQNWLNNVAATGTLVKPSTLVIGTGTGQIPSASVNGIPTGWTVEESTNEPRLYASGGPSFRFVITGDWPQDGVTRNVGDIEVYDGNDEYQQSYIEITVRNGIIDFDDDDWNRNYGQRYIISNTDRQLVIETELEDRHWYTEFDRYFQNCDDWQTRGYNDYQDCMCQENNLDCPPEP